MESSGVLLNRLMTMIMIFKTPVFLYHIIIMISAVLGDRVLSLSGKAGSTCVGPCLFGVPPIVLHVHPEEKVGGELFGGTLVGEAHPHRPSLFRT